MSKCFSGLIVPLLTPLNENRSLDEVSLAKHIHDLAARGIDGLFVTGTTGEASQLPLSTWREANRVAIREAKSAGIKAYSGAVCPGTLETIERVKMLEDMGADTVFATPVFYANDGTQEQIYLHYQAICAATPLQVVVYHIPFTTHVDIASETLRRIAELPNIIGVKDTVGSLEVHLQNLTLLKDTRVGVACVVESMQAIGLLMGADGVVTALGNFLPELYVRLIKEVEAGNQTAALRAFDRILTFRDILKSEGNGVAGFKALGSLLGLCKPYTAVTCSPVNEAQMAVMRRACAYIQEQRALFAQ